MADSNGNGRKILYPFIVALIVAVASATWAIRAEIARGSESSIRDKYDYVLVAAQTMLLSHESLIKALGETAATLTEKMRSNIETTTRRLQEIDAAIRELEKQ